MNLCEAWIAQSVEHQTFNLRVQGSSPCSGAVLIIVPILDKKVEVRSSEAPMK